MKVVVDRAGALDLATPSSRRNAILCALLFAVCVAIAYPVADVPFGDDFSYTRTALDFARTGHFVYNGWATAMLGWQVLWGALFIKLFGFSFLIVRLSTLPIAMASLYLFHQILVRFGIGPRNAVIGTLSLGLSPLFFLIATTYLTDVPGVFAILLCLYMCQRAVVAPDHRAAVLWLVAAGITNLVGGTVRQTSWLGVLIMVPSTAWLLRHRPRILSAGIATTLLGMVGIFACMAWAKNQIFFVPEPIYISPSRLFSLAVIREYVMTFLCLLLVLSPVLVGWLPAARSLKRPALARIGAVMPSMAIVLVLHSRHLSLQKWLAPWLISFIQVQLWEISLPIIVAISILVAATAIISAEVTFDRLRNPPKPTFNSTHLQTAAWLLGPFFIAYLLVLLPRAATAVIQDRYLLGIVPAAIVFLLLFYERRVSDHRIALALPNLSIAVLTLFALFTIAASHDFYAFLRAGRAGTLELLADHVPRTQIEEDFGTDFWEQLEVVGHVNTPNMVSAATNFNPIPPSFPVAPECSGYQPPIEVPVIRPRYYVGDGPPACLKPTNYPAIRYIAWLPPFHRTRPVEEFILNSDKLP